MILRNVWLEFLRSALCEFLLRDHVFPGPHADVVRLDVAMHVARSVQHCERLTELSKHVEHDASFVVRLYLREDLQLLHKLLDGIAARLHL